MALRSCLTLAKQSCSVWATSGRPIYHIRCASAFSKNPSDPGGMDMSAAAKVAEGSRNRKKRALLVGFLCFSAFYFYVVM